MSTIEYLKNPASSFTPKCVDNQSKNGG